MDFNQLKQIDIKEYFKTEGYSLNGRNTDIGLVLKDCPICNKHNHFLINNEGYMYSFNGCFSGDLLELHTVLNGISRVVAAQYLKDRYCTAKFYNKVKVCRRNIKPVKEILNKFDKEIISFIADISKDYHRKDKRTQTNINMVLKRVLSIQDTVDKYCYVQYIKQDKRNRKDVKK